jgi:hypothetical protein
MTEEWSGARRNIEKRWGGAQHQSSLKRAAWWRAQLRCGGTPVEENRCEVVDERLLTEELLQNLRMKREGLWDGLPTTTVAVEKQGTMAGSLTSERRRWR